MNEQEMMIKERKGRYYTCLHIISIFNRSNTIYFVFKVY